MLAPSRLNTLLSWWLSMWWATVVAVLGRANAPPAPHLPPVHAGMAFPWQLLNFRLKTQHISVQIRANGSFRKRDVWKWGGTSTWHPRETSVQIDRWPPGILQVLFCIPSIYPYTHSISFHFSIITLFHMHYYSFCAPFWKSPRFLYQGQNVKLFPQFPVLSFPQFSSQAVALNPLMYHFIFQIYLSQSSPFVSPFQHSTSQSITSFSRIIWCSSQFAFSIELFDLYS